MMASLWDYINGNVRVDKNSPTGTKAAYVYTAVPRFVVNAGKSVYDSFKRGIQPYPTGGYVDEDMNVRDPRTNEVIRNYSSEARIADALNVAGAAMGGGMPGVPAGNNPSTLGMAFRRPKDVVFTGRGELNPTSSTLKEDLGNNYDLYNLISRYHNKTWGTANDPVIQHIDQGFKVPYIPGLDAKRLNDALLSAQDYERNGQLLALLSQAKPSYAYAAKTDVGKYVELARDNALVNQPVPRGSTDDLAIGLPQKTKDYLRNTEDANAFVLPSILDLTTKQLPYKIEGNLNRMSLADMLMQASEKEAVLAKAPIEKLHEFDDGHYWIQLKTQAQREAESDAMGNSTRLPMHDGKDLYSLRDKNGKSVLTASRLPGKDKFDEIKTRFNDVDVLNLIRTSGKGAKFINTYMHAKTLKDILGLKGETW
jgi:hypothetical protein